MRTKSTLTFLAAMFFAGGLFSQTIDLPRFATDLERQIASPPFLPIGITTPPSTPVRTMAEWEE